MTHPAPMGDHIAGYTHPAGGPGAERYGGAHESAGPPPQWAPDPSYGGAPPPPPYQSYPPAASAGYPPQYVPGMNPTNALAIASLVIAIVGWAPIAVILGHLALVQIRRSNGYERGEGLALAGLIIGYIQIALALAALAFFALSLSFFTIAPGN